MGWDAYATVNGKYLKCEYPHDNSRLKTTRIKDKKLDRAFKYAWKKCIKKYESVDVYLDSGALDCSPCARFLEKATGMNCYGGPISPKEIKRLNKIADWDFKYDKDHKGLYGSAKIFLETCARLGLGMRFSC